MIRHGIRPVVEHQVERKRRVFNWAVAQVCRPRRPEAQPRCVGLLHCLYPTAEAVGDITKRARLRR